MYISSCLTIPLNTRCGIGSCSLHRLKCRTIPLCCSHRVMSRFFVRNRPHIPHIVATRRFCSFISPRRYSGKVRVLHSVVVTYDTFFPSSSLLLRRFDFGLVQIIVEKLVHFRVAFSYLCSFSQLFHSVILFPLRHHAMYTQRTGRMDPEDNNDAEYQTRVVTYVGVGPIQSKIQSGRYRWRPNFLLRWVNNEA